LFTILYFNKYRLKFDISKPFISISGFRRSDKLLKRKHWCAHHNLKMDVVQKEIKLFRILIFITLLFLYELWLKHWNLHVSSG